MGYEERSLECFCLREAVYSIMVKTVGAGYISDLCFPLAHHVSLGNLPDSLGLSIPFCEMMIMILHPQKTVFKVK